MEPQPNAPPIPASSIDATLVLLLTIVLASLLDVWTAFARALVIGLPVELIYNASLAALLPGWPTLHYASVVGLLFLVDLVIRRR
jgi:hypothetical protein